MAIEVGLDLAGKTGVAIRDADTHEVVYTGLWILTRGNIGGRRSPIPAVRLMSRLWQLQRRFEIRRVIFEETFAQGDAKFRLDSLQTVVMLWAIKHGITWKRVSPASVKKHATGSGAVRGKRKVNKLAVWQAAIDRWPKLYIHDDNIADALWVLDCLGE